MTSRTSAAPGNNRELGLLAAVLLLSGALAYTYTVCIGNGGSASSSSSSSASWASNGISESSSGTLFRAVRSRSYPDALLFSKWTPPLPLQQQRGPVPALRPKDGRTCKNWAVTTSIFAPTTTIKQIASLPDWCLVIAGDKKAPKDYNVSGGAIYLSPADQERMPFATGKLLRWNHFGRKNLGFLYAVQHGARWVYDTDDDNELQSLATGIPIPRPNHLIDEVETSFKLYNLYPQMSTVRPAAQAAARLARMHACNLRPACAHANTRTCSLQTVCNPFAALALLGLSLPCYSVPPWRRCRPRGRAASRSNS